MNFKERLVRFFYGRNGSDDLCRFLSWAAVAALLLSSIFGGAAGGHVSMFLWLAGLAMVTWSIFRSLSKNLDKHRASSSNQLMSSDIPCPYR